MKMNAMLAELEAVLPLCSYAAAVPATIANVTDMPRQEAMSIFRRPTMSCRRAKSTIVSNPYTIQKEPDIPPKVAAIHPVTA
jgi:hypothetical protein